MDQAEKDPAQILEDAADLLMIHGVNRDGTHHNPATGTYCTAGAIGQVMNGNPNTGWLTEAARHVCRHLRRNGHPEGIAPWNDKSGDDFEVIDTLRLVAKSLRNGE